MKTKPPDQITKANQDAWTTGRYAAWEAAFGGAQAEAQRIKSDPKHILRRIAPYLEPFQGKRICNIQGSHGRIAVALAVLGAKVQVIDFSEENRRFATALAKAAGVSIDYAVCDVMEAEQLDLPHKFDALVLELGILHYHRDLEKFFSVMRTLSDTGGTLFLNEFHPLQRKLFWPSGPRNYFSNEIIKADVPNPDHAGASLVECQYRFWTMGEVLNAVIKGGFRITRLDEHPDWDDNTIPGTFTLIAQA